DNDFAMVGTGNPGEITVVARNGTAINGVLDGSVTVSGVTKDLEVRIQWNTNNNISVDNVFLAGNLLMSLPSNGENTIVLGANDVVSTTGRIGIDYYGTHNTIRMENYNVFAGESIWVSGVDYGSSDIISIVGASTATGDVIV